MSGVRTGAVGWMAGLAGLACAALAVGLSGCQEKPKPLPKGRGLSDWLVECSPYSSYDGGKVLTFDYDGTVDLDRGDNKAAWDKSLPEHLKAKWFGDEGTDSLTVTLPGQPPVKYVLQTPAAGHECILGPNASPVVDLRKAWLGSLHMPDGEDDEEDP